MATNSAAQFPYYYKSSSQAPVGWLNFLTSQFTNPSSPQPNQPNQQFGLQDSQSLADIQKYLQDLQQSGSLGVAMGASTASPTSPSVNTPASTTATSTFPYG